MRESNISIKEIADITQAIADYQSRQSYFPQMNYPRGSESSERLDKLLEEFKSDKGWWKSPVLNRWNEIEIHISTQVWGSTACGWGGIGGSAMTSQLNVIIYNLYIKHAFVYWGGELAYVCPIEEIKEGFRVPSITSVKNAIYKRTRK